MAKKPVAVESNTAPVSISFNQNAVMAFDEACSDAHRFRVAAKDGRLFIKPTYRKAGPHVFADYIKSGKEDGKGNLKVTLEGRDLDKLGVNLEPGTKYAVQKDKYGWFFLTDEGTEEAVQGAKASIMKRAGGAAKSAGDNGKEAA